MYVQDNTKEKMCPVGNLYPGDIFLDVKGTVLLVCRSEIDDIDVHCVALDSGEQYNYAPQIEVIPVHGKVEFTRYSENDIEEMR